MRYIKNYTTYLFENKNTFNWSELFTNMFEPITNKKHKAKLEQLLMRDIFSKANNFLDNDDKKIYPQLSTSKKFDVLMDIKYNPDMIGEYMSNLVSITDTLSNEPNTDISTYKSFKELVDYANEWHENLDVVVTKSRRDETPDTDKFIIYPDGWYWINLNTSFSEDEKNNMGHCGMDEGKILFSLRDDEKQSHITVSYNPSNKTVYQIKGRKNTKPKSIYHDKIIDMLLNDKHVINIIGTGWYKPELDFSLTDLPEDIKNDILNKKPMFVYTSAMFEKYFNNDNQQMIISMCSNGYIYDGTNIKKYSTDEEVSEFIENIEKYKIKDKNILKNIITSCCLSSLDNMRYWSSELLSYMKTLDIQCTGRTLLTQTELKNMMDNFGYMPSHYLIRKYVEAGEFETVEYITSKQGKIKFDAAYLDSIINDISSDIDIPYTKLPKMFDFTLFQFTSHMCSTSERNIPRIEHLANIIVNNTNKKDINFLTYNVIAFVKLIKYIRPITKKCFGAYAKAFNFDSNIYYNILKEMSYDTTPNDISNLSVLFYSTGIVDAVTVFKGIGDCEYMINNGVAIFDFFINSNIDQEILMKYLNTTDNLKSTIQVLHEEIQHNYSDLTENLDKNRKVELFRYFNNDIMLLKTYNQVYVIISNSI